MTWRVPYPIPLGEDSSSKRIVRIPTGICELVAEQRLYGEFALYLYLKTNCDGRMYVDKTVFAAAAKALQVSEKTVRRRFKVLVDRDWIGQMKNGLSIIRAFKVLRQMENCPSREAVYFDMWRDFQRLTIFVRSACIGHLVKKQKDRLRRERFSEGKKGTSFEKNHPLPTSYKVACKALAQIYKISIGSAFTWKKEGNEAKYLKVTKVLKPLLIDNLQMWKRVYPDDVHRLIIRDNKYFLQEPDKVECNLSFCRLRACDKPRDKN